MSARDLSDPDAAPDLPERTAGPGLEGVLHDSTAPQAALQEKVSAFLGAASTPEPGDTLYSTSDTLDEVRGWVSATTGRRLGHFPVWVRLFRPDLGRGLLAVLHSPTPHGEVDLIVTADKGALDRTVLRALLRWAFHANGWTRIVARVPPERADLGDYLRRVGFRHEGVARNGLGFDADAQVWALTPRDMLHLLPRSQRPVARPPERVALLPDITKVH